MPDHTHCPACGSAIVRTTVAGKPVALNATRVPVYVDDPGIGIDLLRFKDIDRGAMADAERPYLVRVAHSLTCSRNGGGNGNG